MYNQTYNLIFDYKIVKFNFSIKKVSKLTINYTQFLSVIFI